MDVVVVHFVGGAILVVARRNAYVEALRQRSAAEAFEGANGAGDAFAAGFLLARHQQLGL